MKSFSSNTLPETIVKALLEKEISVPTEVQAKCIPLLLDHNGDFVGRSATGTGKTYAYGVPLLARLNSDLKQIQAVIMVPTRELCEQVGRELKALAKFTSFKIGVIYGGMPSKEQIKRIDEGVNIVVATPGRLMDLVKRKAIDLSSLQFVVFDEADEMLQKGYKTDIDVVLRNTDRTYSSWLFSATMPDELNSMIKKYLNRELKKVIVGTKERTNTGIEHYLIEVTAEEKQDILLHYLTKYGDQKSIIFCRTKSGVQKLYKQLSASKFSCGAVHGDLPQGLRNKVMEQYRSGHINLLIATDVASRGIDVQDISHVIQYHIPDTLDSYIHRSGRTSRTKATGSSITFAFPEEMEKFSLIEKELQIGINRLSAPNLKDQLVNRAILWGRKLAKTKPVGDKLDETSKEDFKDQLRHLSKDELLEKLLANYLRENQ